MTALSGLLDELMGKNRNAAPNEKTNELHWSDEEVNFFVKINKKILLWFITV